jgi:hypothetical protein
MLASAQHEFGGEIPASIRKQLLAGDSPHIAN